jgi:hypothetical protein
MLNLDIFLIIVYMGCLFRFLFVNSSEDQTISFFIYFFSKLAFISGVLYGLFI